LGIGFAAKRVVPKAPLWVLLVATQALDLLCYAFMSLGIERMAESTVDLTNGIQFLTEGSVPWSHGLFMSLVWSLGFGALAGLLWRDRRTGIAVGLAVFSHWVLDFIVHLPDLPVLFEGSPLLGLGLWGSGPGLILSGVLEVALLVGGIVLYWQMRKQSTVLQKGSRPG
jgi:hypothetical protein